MNCAGNVTIINNKKRTITINVNRGPIGLSAYELAVQNGYTGTLEEWLNAGINPVKNEETYSPDLNPVSAGQSLFILQNMPNAKTIRFTVNQGTLSAGYDYTVSGRNLMLLPNAGFSLDSSDVVQITYESNLIEV